MKIKERFVLADVDEHTVAVPVDDSANSFKGIVRMNKTASLIWKCISSGMEIEEITEEMLKHYDIDRDTARSCIEETIDKMRKDGFIED